MDGLIKVIEGQASAGRCTATVDFMEEELRPYPATVNDEGLYVHAKAVAEILLGEVNVSLCDQVMTAEDFGFYAQKIPTTFFFVGARCAGEEITHVHTSHLVIDEDVLPVGAALHAAVAIEFFSKNEPCHGVLPSCILSKLARQ
jgi:IAA-amino acid hydrolase